MLHFIIGAVAYLSAVMCPIQWAQQLTAEPPYAHIIEDRWQYYHRYEEGSSMFAWTMCYEWFDESMNDDLGL